MRITKEIVKHTASRLSNLSGLDIKVRQQNGYYQAVIVMPTTGEITIGSGTAKEVHKQLCAVEMVLWYLKDESNIH